MHRQRPETPQAFLEKPKSGRVVLRICNMCSAAGPIDGMCQGWDFVWIDGLMSGPNDMKMEMGFPSDVQVTENNGLRNAMAQTARTALNDGKFAACIAATPTALSIAVEMGSRVIVAGGDITFLANGAVSRLNEFREALGGIEKPHALKKSAGAY